MFELLMRRYNQRVYRAVRAIVRDEEEAEDIMQQAYVKAFTTCGSSTASARFSTWFTPDRDQRVSDARPPTCRESRPSTKKCSNALSPVLG